MRRAILAAWAETRASWMTAMQYRASFLSEAVVALGWVGWTVVPLLFVFRFREGIAGWTANEALLVVGFFVTLEGILDGFIDPNLRAVVEHIRRGTLDYVLLKPVDAQVLVSFHRSVPVKLPHIVAGLVVVAVASLRLETPPGPLDTLMAAGLLLGGVVLIFSLYTLVVSTSFWFVRVDNLSFLLHTSLEAGRWPVSFYQGAVRVLLTFVLPVGMMTTWPALALRGALQPGAVLEALGMAIVFFGVSRCVWMVAVRHYTSASS